MTPTLRIQRESPSQLCNLKVRGSRKTHALVMPQVHDQCNHTQQVSHSARPTLMYKYLLTARQVMELCALFQQRRLGNASNAEELRQESEQDSNWKLSAD